jgi:hypothetical protein
MADSEEFFAVIREDDKNLFFAFGPLAYARSTARRWADGDKAESSIEPEKESVEEVFSHHSNFSEALSSAVDFCLSQYQILLLLSSIGSGIPQSYIKSQIFKKIEKEGQLFDEDRGSRIYKMDGKLRDEIYANDKRATVLKIGSEKIGPSVFLGMVASFDALIVSIVGRLIQQNPYRFVGKEKTINMSEVLSANSIEDLVEGFVSDELFRLSRESHEYQNNYIENQFSIKIRETWKRYPDYIEVFERRNLIAHGEVNFNARYVGVCEKVGHSGAKEQLGKKLELRTNYQKQAIYLLSEYAILLAFVLWRKHASENESAAFETLNEAAYKLIQEGHYVLAKRILSFALSLKNADVKDEVRKMMIVNNASAVAGRDKQSEAVKILDSEDWSASALQFQISVAALKSDIGTVLKLLPPAQKLGFDMVNFRTWPVFRFIRTDESFNDLFEELYGERLTERESIVEQKSDNEETGAGPSVH